MRRPQSPDNTRSISLTVFTPHLMTLGLITNNISLKIFADSDFNFIVHEP